MKNKTLSEIDQRRRKDIEWRRSLLEEALGTGLAQGHQLKIGDIGSSDNMLLLSRGGTPTSEMTFHLDRSDITILNLYRCPHLSEGTECPRLKLDTFLLSRAELRAEIQAFVDEAIALLDMDRKILEHGGDPAQPDPSWHRVQPLAANFARSMGVTAAMAVDAASSHDGNAERTWEGIAGKDIHLKRDHDESIVWRRHLRRRHVVTTDLVLLRENKAILSLREAAGRMIVTVHGKELPETVLGGVARGDFRKIIDHPAIERMGEMPILGIRNRDGAIEIELTGGPVPVLEVMT